MPKMQLTPNEFESLANNSAHIQLTVYTYNFSKDILHTEPELALGKKLSANICTEVQQRYGIFFQVNYSVIHLQMLTLGAQTDDITSTLFKNSLQKQSTRQITFSQNVFVTYYNLYDKK